MSWSIPRPSTSTARDPLFGGIILSSEAFIAEHIHNFMRQTGPSMSPFNAWVLLKGLETLAVRVRAQTETAAKVGTHSPAIPRSRR